MKSLLLTLLIFISTLTYSQDSVNIVLTDVYPQTLIIDNMVKGVIFTVEQAQKIDNDYDLFNVMDSIVSEYGISDSITIAIIDSQGKQITNLKTQLKNSDSLLLNRNFVIKELNDKIELDRVEIDLLHQKEESYIKENKELRKALRKERIKKVVAYVTSGVAIVGIVILSIITK